MPSTKRALRHARVTEDRPELEEICTLGCRLGDGPEHVSYPPDPAEWRDYLTETEGFYIFFEWLLRREGPITEREAATMEKSELPFSTSEVVYFGMETEAGVDALNLSPARLRNTAKYFNAAAEWHDRRGRPGLSEKYRLRAAACRAAIPISTEVVSHDG